MYCAQVKIPPITKGKRYLSQLEVDTSRQLSAVRIHVERVIGVLRQKYSFLEGTCLWLLTMDTACRGIARILRKKGQDCARSALKILDRKPHPLIKSRAPYCAL